MNTPKLMRITSLVFEHEKEDGTIETCYLEDSTDFELGYMRFLYAPDQPEQKFWLATDHQGLNKGACVIGTAPRLDIPVDREKVTDRTNQMIGLIKDGTCSALVTYDVPGMALIVPPKV